MARRGFADATCKQLLSILARASALDKTRPLPSGFAVELEELTREDSFFATWLGHVRGCEQASNGSFQPNIHFFQSRLPKLLVSDSHWSASEEWKSLLQNMCHVLLRLEAFGDSFDCSLQASVELRKSEAVYQLAYGLSHELNNPLAIISTRAGVLANSEENHERRMMLQSIVDTAMRGHEMLGDLMLVAKPPRLNPRDVALRQLLESLVSKATPHLQTQNVTFVLEHELNFGGYDDVLLHIDLAATLEAVWAVVRNAAEAMLGGGVIRVSTSSTVDMLILTVCDTGSGLSEEAIRHCFDPYYSGREAGRGLGLGLTKAKRILALQGGNLELKNNSALHSNTSQGCSAIVSLPLSDA